jgi:putative methionine-R-sulfoxide reductase with GAF domain
MENLLAMGKDGVGNDLLEGGVLLRAGTRQEEIVLPLEKGGKVSGGVGLQALECSEEVQEFPSNDQNVLFCFWHG